MKTYVSLVVLALLMLSSCKKYETRLAQLKSKPVIDSIVDSNEVHVSKEYFSNGKIKTESEAKGNRRHGLTKNYDKEGYLLSMVNFKNNIKDGLATNYYERSDKVYSTMVYKDGLKDGDEIWYYESGKPYRVTPYVKGKSNGIQKYYYEDGKLKAEVPWKDGKPGTGLKEYKNDGSLVTGYPHISIKQRDYITQANKVILYIEMSDGKSEAKFYRGSLHEGKYLNNKQFELAKQNGISQIDFNVPPGAAINETVIISANAKSQFGYPLILTKTFVVNAVNNN